MYGTIFRMKAKSGEEQRLIDVMREWHSQLKPKIEGAVDAYVMKAENKPREYIGVAVFKDRESYMANADNPEQDKWYRKLRDLLEADPEWEDGEYVAKES